MCMNDVRRGKRLLFSLISLRNGQLLLLPEEPPPRSLNQRFLNVFLSRAGANILRRVAGLAAAA